MTRDHRAWSTIAAGVAVALVALLQPATAGASQDRSSVSGAITPETDELSPVVRVNPVGYVTSAPKMAFAMLPRKVSAVRFEVVTPLGVVYRGTSTDDNVVSWPSVEPAGDYTAGSLLGFALGAAGLG